MFNNIGSKIKGLASVICFGGIVLCIIIGIVVAALDEDLILAGFAIMILGALLSWVSSFVLYGFGELVENSAIIAGKETLNENEYKEYHASINDTTDRFVSSEESFKNNQDNRPLELQILDSQLAKGLITQEIYDSAKETLMKKL